MHQLDGAYEQIRGAREHLDALRPEIEDFIEVIANSVSLKYRRGFVKIRGHHLLVPIGTAGFPVNRPAPLRLSRLIGETIESLRKALDYLVYQLSYFDSNSIIDNTQFVILDSPKDFKLQRQRRLRGLTADHVTMFERLQPYNGCNWTKMIRELSNPDKHRTLTAVKHPVLFSLDSSNTEAILAGKNINKDKYACIRITFNNGMPVIEGIEQLVWEVDITIHSFYFEFK
jgi:hypothetical protein